MDFYASVNDDLRMYGDLSPNEVERLELHVGINILCRFLKYKPTKTYVGPNLGVGLAGSVLQFMIKKRIKGVFRRNR